MKTLLSLILLLSSFSWAQAMLFEADSPSESRVTTPAPRSMRHPAGREGRSPFKELVDAVCAFTGMESYVYVSPEFIKKAVELKDLILESPYSHTKIDATIETMLLESSEEEVKRLGIGWWRFYTHDDPTRKDFFKGFPKEMQKNFRIGTLRKIFSSIFSSKPTPALLNKLEENLLSDRDIYALAATRSKRKFKEVPLKEALLSQRLNIMKKMKASQAIPQKEKHRPIMSFFCHTAFRLMNAAPEETDPQIRDASYSLKCAVYEKKKEEEVKECLETRLRFLDPIVMVVSGLARGWNTYSGARIPKDLALSALYNALCLERTKDWLLLLSEESTHYALATLLAEKITRESIFQDIFEEYFDGSPPRRLLPLL